LEAGVSARLFGDPRRSGFLLLCPDFFAAAGHREKTDLTERLPTPAKSPDFSTARSASAARPPASATLSLRRRAPLTSLADVPSYPAFATILRWKLRALGNARATLEKHVVIHFILFFGLVAGLVTGGTIMFWKMFAFLLRQDIIGPPMVDRLVSMALLVFFTMLIFSNLIITLSTTYISREIDYFMSQPVSHHSIFSFKLIETIFYSSWAFVILSCPLFLGYGMAKDLPPTFYLGALALIGPFLLIPAAGGAVVTMVFAAMVPAKRSRSFMVGVLALAMMGAIVAARLSGFGQMMRSADFADFKQALKLLEIGRVPLMPNTWMAEGTYAAARGDWAGVAYWFAVLLSTGLFLLQVCLWLVGPLYYRGWCLARGASGQGLIDPDKSFFNKIDPLFLWLGRPWKALIGKDLRVFWRDPAQWSQLAILLGLLFIYVANIRHAARMEGVNIFRASFQTIISFLNMGATCFILSILSTRFFYPMLSLEGRQYWVIGLAPIKRSSLLWEKFFFCVVSSLAITVPLMLFSNIMLKVPPILFWRSLAALAFLSFGLTSLSVGLGAMTPNFREDNPARIANGLGGTMNIVLSLLYISLTLALVSFPTFVELAGHPDTLAVAIVEEWKWGFLAAFLLVNAVAIIVPMRLGIKRWNEMEF
jgi:ABC-2 type transport system permease protein